jgi:hypothetical protein
MTADVAVRQDAAALVTPLTVWAQSAREAAAVARSLARTPFVPDSLRAKRTYAEQTQDDLDSITASNITAAILTGQEIGIEPMASLRSIDVIQGTPALRAVALRALVLTAGHEIWVEESTQTRAIVKGRRKGSDHIQESVWTLDRARGLSLLGKDNWRKQPGAMLVARATSECARLVAADALLGVPYSAEELNDGIEVVGVGTETPASKTTRTARRRTAQPAAVVRPEAEVESDPEPDFEETENLEADDIGPEPEPETPSTLEEVWAADKATK